MTAAEQMKTVYEWVCEALGDKAGSDWLWSCTPYPCGAASPRMLYEGLSVAAGERSLDSLMAQVENEMQEQGCAAQGRRTSMKVHILEGTDSRGRWLFACGRSTPRGTIAPPVGRAKLKEYGLQVTCRPCRRKHAAELAGLHEPPVTHHVHHVTCPHHEGVTAERDAYRQALEAIRDNCPGSAAIMARAALGEHRYVELATPGNGKESVP